MDATQPYYEYLILDADPPVTDLGGLAVGDIDGDGHDEIVVAGDGALLWYRPDGSDRGIIAEGVFAVGLAIGDIDGNGRNEVVAAEEDSATSSWMISWFASPERAGAPWQRNVLDPACTGNPHDILVHDVDGDGRLEVLANAAYTDAPGVFLYRADGDLARPWAKHTVSTGHFAEGLSVGDLNGDGRVEIVHGPDWFQAPLEGPYSGPWLRRVYAPAFREMARTAVVDVTGDGLAEIVIVESEYPDGRLSWFENRGVEQGEVMWYEHRLEERLSFAHSLHAWREADGTTRCFVAEMAKGGWDAPYNWDARLLEFRTSNGGRSWQRTLLAQGTGTHQAIMVDVDGDGVREVVGKAWGKALGIPCVHLWHRRDEAPALAAWRHLFVDRDKPGVATDVLAADLDGDDLADVICGAWWYRSPDWVRRTIPGVAQVLCAGDVDGDGLPELVATRAPDGAEQQSSALTSRLCWLKPIDPLAGAWEMHDIGIGSGDWPHGAALAPVLPDGRLALVIGYHNASQGQPPELFEVPDDPRRGPWPHRVLADIPYGEELLPSDLDGDGDLDIVAGPYWLENRGDGTFAVHALVDGWQVARVAVADVNGNGRLDVILGEEVLDFENRVTPWSRVAWLEHPEDPRSSPWIAHVIDKVRCPHSLDVADLDGDGEPEIIVGEHDPFKPYRSRCRLMIYKRANGQGSAWTRYLVDDRFEHHDGAQVADLGEGVRGILSHGWKDSRYVHLWELV